MLLLYAIVIYPPYIMSLLPQWSSLYTNLSKAAFYSGVVLIAIGLLRRKISKIYFSIVLFTVWLFFCDMMNGLGGMPPALFEMVKILGVCSLLKILYRYKYEEVFFDVWGIYYFLIVTINCITLFVYPNGIVFDKSIGWQPYYFIGNANRYAFVFIFAFFINAIYCIRKEKFSFRIYALTVVCVVSSIKSGLSSTALIVSLALLITLLLNNEFIRTLALKYIKYIIIITISLVLLMVGGGWKTHIFQETLKELTGETLSFLERGYIWSNAVKLIMESPIWGHGSFIASYSFGYAGALRSSHNTFLQLMIYGGIPTFIILMYLIFMTLKVSIKKLSKQMGYINLVCILIILLCFAFEQYPFYIGIFVVMAVADLEARRLTE